MREDMKHVIIDRPRQGGEGGKSRAPKGSLRRWLRIPEDEYPRSESSSRHRRYGWRCKGLNEHLSPLRHWLRSECGRPRNKVYAEICESLSVRNATTAHVRDHAEKYVLRDARLIDGVLCDSKGEPINVSGWRPNWHAFYVDPRTGILRESPPWKRPRRVPREKDYVDGTDSLHQYRLLNGIWFEVKYAPYPADGLRYGRMSREEAGKRYGRYIYQKMKRQLGKNEIRHLRLWNTPFGRQTRNAALGFSAAEQIPTIAR